MRTPFPSQYDPHPSRTKARAWSIIGRTAVFRWRSCLRRSYILFNSGDPVRTDLKVGYRLLIGHCIPKGLLSLLPPGTDRTSRHYFRSFQSSDWLHVSRPSPLRSFQAIRRLPSISICPRADFIEALTFCHLLRFRLACNIRPGRQTCYKTETMDHGYPKRAIPSP